MTPGTHDQQWHRPKPEHLPRPTYCPAVMAVAIMLMVWAPLASWALLGAGAGLFVLAAACWIRELRDDYRSS